MERGTCFFAVKAANAEQAGAVGVLVFNNEAGPLDGTLGDPQATSIPVAGIARSLGLELAGTENAIVEMELLTETRAAMSRNVTADTQPRGERVLLVGAHLDSVRAGAGINDNGTGVAAVLEIARALRAQGRPLTVRVAFWGAEELGLFGSRAYARTVGPDNVVGYLNLDVLGSPSRQYAVYGSGPLAMRLLLPRAARTPREDDRPAGALGSRPSPSAGFRSQGCLRGLCVLPPGLRPIGKRRSHGARPAGGSCCVRRRFHGASAAVKRRQRTLSLVVRRSALQKIDDGDEQVEHDRCGADPNRRKRDSRSSERRLRPSEDDSPAARTTGSPVKKSTSVTTPRPERTRPITLGPARRDPEPRALPTRTPRASRGR